MEKVQFPHSNSRFVTRRREIDTKWPKKFMSTILPMLLSHQASALLILLVV